MNELANVFVIFILLRLILIKSKFKIPRELGSKEEEIELILK